MYEVGVRGCEGGVGVGVGGSDLVREDVWHSEEWARARAAADLHLDLARETRNRRGGELFGGKLVKGLFKVRDREHRAELEDRVRVRRTQLLLVDLERERLPLRVLGVARPPRRVAHERVEEHGLASKKKKDKEE